jgi:hypothetical protein
MNRGRIGVPLQKLSEVVKETENFLKMLAEDVELPGDKRQWLGLDFQSGSLRFIAEYATPVEPRQFSEFSSSFDDVRRGRLGRVRPATRIQYAHIAEPLANDEAVDFGIYKTPDDTIPEFLSLSKRDLALILGEIQQPVESQGAVQGIIHSLFMGSQPPHFFLRELSTDNLVKCIYHHGAYPQLARALQRESAVVHVYGTLKTNVDERRVEQVNVDKIDLADEMSEQEFNNVFGCSPNFTGSLTTQEFIDHIRGRNGEA